MCSWFKWRQYVIVLQYKQYVLVINHWQCVLVRKHGHCVIVLQYKQCVRVTNYWQCVLVRKHGHCILSYNINNVFLSVIIDSVFLSENMNGKLNTKIYDKRDDFSFPIVNYPFLDGDVPLSPSYGV